MTINRQYFSLSKCDVSGNISQKKSHKSEKNKKRNFSTTFLEATISYDEKALWWKRKKKEEREEYSILIVVQEKKKKKGFIGKKATYVVVEAVVQSSLHQECGHVNKTLGGGSQVH